MARKYDWQEVYIDYVTGTDSIKALSEKYSIPVSAVQSRSTREGWGQQRKIFRVKMRDKTADKISSDLARKLKKEFNTATKMSKIISDALKDADQFYRYVSQGDGAITDTVLKTLNTARLSQAAKALKDLSEIKKAAGDLISEVEARRYGIGASNDDETGVIILPEIEE